MPDNFPAETSNPVAPNTPPVESASTLASFELFPKAVYGRPSTENASEIIPGRLYLSGIITPQTLEELQVLGITHVVSVFDSEVPYPPEYAMKTLHLRIDDLPNVKILPVLNEATKFIRQAFETEPDSRVLVHCFMGISRSASVVIGYLLATTEMTLGEALAFVRRKRSIIRPNRGFLKQLREYDQWFDHQKKKGAVRTKIVAETRRAWGDMEEAPPKAVVREEVVVVAVAQVPPIIKAPREGDRDH